MAPPLRVIWTRRAACGNKPAMSEPSRAKPKKPAKDRAAKLKAAEDRRRALETQVQR